MSILALDLMLALAWVVLTGEVSVQNFFIGLLLGTATLWLARRAIGPQAETAFDRLPRLVGFLLFFLKELTVANFRVLVTVLMPQGRLRPAIISVPLDLTSNLGITMLANLITLTPGTLALDVADDCGCMYVHAIYVRDEAEFRAEIKGLERRLMAVLA